MSKQQWKPGNLLYPLPAVMVSCAGHSTRANIITVAWTGTVCTNPPLCYISVRPERHSYRLIRETGEFVVNLTTRRLARQTDWCGVRSGREFDKFKETGLTALPAEHLQYAPLIAECPVNIECRVMEVKELGSHHMFLAQVLGVSVEESLLAADGRFRLNEARPLVYSHGQYFDLGEQLGHFGYSVKKKPRKARKRK